jgi:hypothetical protein
MSRRGSQRRPSSSRPPAARHHTVRRGKVAVVFLEGHAEDLAEAAGATAGRRGLVELPQAALAMAPFMAS